MPLLLSERAVQILPRSITRVLDVAGAVAMGMMMLQISADALSRTLFSKPLAGTLEYVTYFYMVAVVFLPLARVQQERGHVFVEVFTNFLPNSVTTWIDRGAQVLTLAYVAFISWWGWQEAMRAFSRDEIVVIINTEVPLWPSRLLVPLGLAMMGVIILVQLFCDLGEHSNAEPTDNKKS